MPEVDLLLDEQALRASRLVTSLQESDPAALSLGIKLGDISPGRVTLEQPIRPEMLNGHGIVHGGYLFLLADTAFAYCCASLGRLSVTRNAEIAFIAAAHGGTALTATAAIRTTYGRNSICDISITTDHGKLLAEFRGTGSVMSTVK
ncbi:PaaI family thioesterase [Arthrobacter sp. 2MCAF15]|uniref:PaaI family thioesterase n=1 Tax=Arthrobacter sp. 2MCAF15 TaxID=3232984 RepID=UPI003F900EB6